MLVGLGSGSTIRFLVDALGRRVREEGLRFTGVPTSEATARTATALGIPLAEPDANLDLALDGTDELVRADFQLIKGLGGALLREKIVAQLATRFVIIADERKVVPVLGLHAPLPVEVTRFGLAATTRRVAALGGRPVLRLASPGVPFVTDGGNLILDCPGFGPIHQAVLLDQRLRSIAGVLETGFFLELATQAYIGKLDGSVEICQPVLI
jgi:ribose 5-phosphate isomerase A